MDPGSAPVASSSPQPCELASLGDGPAIVVIHGMIIMGEITLMGVLT